MREIKTVSILGVNGFPYGTARIEKLKLIGKSLVIENVKVDFVCHSWGKFSSDDEIPVKGQIEGINYIYTCGRTTRPEKFLQRRWVNLKGKIMEMVYLFKNNCDLAIVSLRSGMFFPLFFYWVAAKFLHFKIYYPHHENEDTELNKENWYHRINLFLFKKFAWVMVDGAFPISDYLSLEIKKKNPALSVLKIPALVDFDYFDDLKKSDNEKNEKYFMYCGAPSYFKIIDFIISAFEKVNNENYKLFLVSSGNKEKERILLKRIAESPKKEQILSFGFLGYKELVAKYLNASALLIPLRNTVQDMARFPHKIGEYTASGNPIITSETGDVASYFQHKKNALLARNFDVDEFANLMEYVINNPAEVRRIGKNGYLTGMDLFNYKAYGAKLLTFFKEEN